jgi:hypothetical protein
LENGDEQPMDEATIFSNATKRGGSMGKTRPRDRRLFSVSQANPSFAGQRCKTTSD